jgi:hypothetical protein
MTRNEPVTEHADLGFPVSPHLTPWPEAVECLAQAQNYWLTTVRPDGKPHVAPVWGAWLDGGLYICTSERSRKARNFAQEPRCCVSIDSETLQIVIEGRVSRTSDEEAMRRVGETYGSKYGWGMTPKDGGLADAQGNSGPVYLIEPDVVFGYGFFEGAYTATRWRFV